jgi:hypothetical protein
MEANLTRLESKLDALLAQFEAAAGLSVPEEEHNEAENEAKGRDGAKQGETEGNGRQT